MRCAYFLHCALVCFRVCLPGWNTNASIIFIDQPAGTGFSYADEGDVGPFNEMEIADNVYQFLQGFLEQNPKFRAAPFYLTGESYAGTYVRTPRCRNLLLRISARSLFRSVLTVRALVVVL